MKPAILLVDDDIFLLTLTAELLSDWVTESRQLEPAAKHWPCLMTMPWTCSSRTCKCLACMGLNSPDVRRPSGPHSRFCTAPAMRR